MIEEILDEDHFENIVCHYKNKPLLIFQHNCQLAESSEAYKTLKEFLEKYPTLDCLMIDASEKRSLVAYLERKSGFPFSCPQVLFFFQGHFVSRTKSDRLTFEELEKHYHALL
jgi:bacillithiol system protein YtxJ